MKTTKVLIIGGGPVGLAVSIDLSRWGVEHTLIEKDAKEARAEHPRMDQVGARTMEFIRKWGLVTQVESAGFPRDFDRDVVYTTGLLSYELEREPFLCDAKRSPPAFSPQKHELCPQNYFDPVLQEAAERSVNSTILYQTQLLGFEDLGDKVIAEIQRVDGTKEKICTDYLVACDGATSTVAKNLGIVASNATLLVCSTNIFISSPELTKVKGPNRGYRHILVDEQGVWGSMANIDGQSLWRLQVLGDQNQQTWTLEAAEAQVHRALRGDIEWSLASITPWMRRELVVDHYSKGRCYLIGDAAHQLSPTGGYGMNTGIAEAFDISWKLAAVIQGWGGDRLLDTYDQERRPVAKKNVQTASGNFRSMTSIAPEPAIFEDSPEGEAVRKRVGETLRERMSQEWDSWGIHLGADYAGSPIVASEDTSPLTESPHSYIQSARPGSRAPHAWLQDGRSTLDLFGYGFTLLVFAPEIDTDPLISAASSLGVPLVSNEIIDPEIFKLYEKPLVLVRPDGHVAWRGDSVPDDATALINLIRGA